MKIYTLSFYCVFSLLFLQGVTNKVYSQAPQKINYQAVARDASGNPLAAQSVQVTFRIRENSPSGVVRYRGAQLYTTNPIGIFTATIGQTANDSGLFSGIAWGSKNYFLQVLVLNTDMGTTQLLSVPYALHANTADSITSTSTNYNMWKRSSGNVYFSNGNDNLGIGTSSPAAKLEVLGKAQISDNSTATGYVSTTSNTIPSGVSGGALNIINAGTRSIRHSAMLIQNLTTKSGGSNSTKIGLEIQSTGSWAPGTLNQPNVGLFVNAAGADINYAAIFAQGNVGVGTITPESALEVNGAFGTTIKTITTSATLDNTATVWYAMPTASMTLTLPNPNNVKNRRYIIVNRSTLTINITPSYVNLVGTTTATLLTGSSLEIISDGANWLQIK